MTVSLTRHIGAPQEYLQPTSGGTQGAWEKPRDTREERRRQEDETHGEAQNGLLRAPSSNQP